MIDCNTYLGTWPNWGLKYNNPAKLKDLMQSEKIRLALVSPLAAYKNKETYSSNSKLYHRIKKSSFFSLVPIVNPTSKNFIKDLDRYLDWTGVRALKLVPCYHNYNLCNKAVLKKLKKIIPLSLIIQIRMEDTRRQPKNNIVPDLSLSKAFVLARKFSDTNILLSGIRFNEVKRYNQDINKCHNIYIDISHIEALDVLTSLSALLDCRKILFGSHVPFFCFQSSILKIKELPYTKRREMTLILEENARKFLKIL